MSPHPCPSKSDGQGKCRTRQSLCESKTVNSQSANAEVVKVWPMAGEARIKMSAVVEMVTTESGRLGTVLVWEVDSQVVPGAEIRILSSGDRPFLVVAITHKGRRFVVGRLGSFADAWSLGESALEVMESELAA